MRRRPGTASANNLLGDALARVGSIREALPHFERALVLDPTGEEIRRNLLRGRRHPEEQTAPGASSTPGEGGGG